MRRLASWCLDVAEAAAAMREKTSGTPQLIAQLDLELDTFRDVLAWMERQGRAEDFLRLAAALGWFWLHRSYRSEGRRWLDSAIAQGTEAGIRPLSWPAHSTAPAFWPSPRGTMTGRAR